VSRSSRAVDLVLFDAVGTLIEPDPPVDEAYYNAGLGYKGLSVSREVIRARFQEIYRATARAQLADQAGRTSEEWELERWFLIVRHVFAEAGDVIGEMIFTRLWQHFAEPNHWRVFPDVEPTITDLRRRGYQIGIASNFDQRLLSICRGHECLAKIEPIFVSSQVGWSKPASQFYKQIESITGLPPERIMLVGDDYENDVGAPRERRWQVIWLRRSPLPIKEGSISSLVELLADPEDQT
jgi:putative hydrolase of the HAD superfamily